MEKKPDVTEKELQEEIEKDRLEHGKAIERKKSPRQRDYKQKRSALLILTVAGSTKGNTSRCFAYAANTCCDTKNNYVIDFEVTAGNVHDSVSFWELYRESKRTGKIS